MRTATRIGSRTMPWTAARKASRADEILASLAAGFAAGILLASFAPLRFSAAALFILLALSLGLYAFALRSAGRFPKAAILLSFALLGAAVGVGRFALADRERGDPALDALAGSRVSAEGVVVEEPDERDRTALLTVELREAAGNAVSGRALVIAERHLGLSYGDRIRVVGVLRSPEPFQTESGRVFDYPSYLAREGIFYQFLFPDVEVVARGEGNPLREKLFAAKGLLLSGIGRVLPEPEGSLLAGLLVGARRGLGEDVEEELRRAGIIHIVVLSGYNMTLVAETVMRVVGFLPRVAAAGVGISAIALFTLMVGASAAALRAAIMALIVLLARASGRTYDMSRALVAAGVLMLLENPKLLAFDPSFELSFLATFGLVALAPRLQPRFDGLPLPRQFREFAVATVATQLAVTPLLLALSGEVSLVALPANLLVLIAIPTTMLLGFLAAILALANPALALPVAFLAYLLLAYILGVGSFFAALPFAAVAP